MGSGYGLSAESRGKSQAPETRAAARERAATATPGLENPDQSVPCLRAKRLAAEKITALTLVATAMPLTASTGLAVLMNHQQETW